MPSGGERHTQIICYERDAIGGLVRQSCGVAGRKVPIRVAVHVGARVAALARASEVLVTSTVQMLMLGSGIGFADRGSHALKGVPSRWRLFAEEHT